MFLLSLRFLLRSLSERNMRLSRRKPARRAGMPGGQSGQPCGSGWQRAAAMN